MWVRTCFQAFGTLLICMHAAFAGAYDDCILESMKGVTSSDAATAIRNACANKFLKLVELSDLSFLDGFANYDPPNLWVTINNKSDIKIQSVTIGVMREVEEARKMAMSLSQSSAAVAAIKLKSELSGHYVQRKEDVTPRRSEAEIDARLRELLADGDQAGSSGPAGTAPKLRSPSQLN
jgi:hypothetical protein